MQVNPVLNTIIEDVSVYGFVKEKDVGNSVLPNNSDFKSVSGQYGNLNYHFNDISW